MSEQTANKSLPENTQLAVDHLRKVLEERGHLIEASDEEIVNLLLNNAAANAQGDPTKIANLFANPNTP